MFILLCLSAFLAISVMQQYFANDVTTSNPQTVIGKERVPYNASSIHFTLSLICCALRHSHLYQYHQSRYVRPYFHPYEFWDWPEPSARNATPWLQTPRFPVKYFLAPHINDSVVCLSIDLYGTVTSLISKVLYTIRCVFLACHC
jgi:hypothetical protein